VFSLFRRRPKLAADRRPPLESDERVVAWAPTPEDEVVVATNRGLWLPGRGRLGWHEIHKAAWSGRELGITPAETRQERDGYTVVADLPVVSYLLPEPGELPHHVRARVTRSVAHTSAHALPGGGAVRIVARRVSGVNGLTWTARYEGAVAFDSPEVDTATDELVGQARAAIALVL
jgi:hypothetical protein